MRTPILGLLAVFVLSAAARAEPPPANLMPRGISGSGWNVMNLDAERAWYEATLGMKMVRSYDRAGKPFEYIMAFEGTPEGGAILALLASPLRKPGPNTTGRLILRVPDSAALAAHLAKQGVESRLVAPGAYFLSDPEGNAIELYTPPKG